MELWSVNFRCFGIPGPICRMYSGSWELLWALHPNQKFEIHVLLPLSPYRRPPAVRKNSRVTISIQNYGKLFLETCVFIVKEALWESNFWSASSKYIWNFVCIVSEPPRRCKKCTHFWNCTFCISNHNFPETEFIADSHVGRGGCKRLWRGVWNDSFFDFERERARKTVQMVKKYSGSNILWLWAP